MTATPQIGVNREGMRTRWSFSACSTEQWPPPHLSGATSCGRPSTATGSVHSPLGSTLYGPEWTAVVRGLQAALLDTAEQLGFAEWLFPRLIPRKAVDNFRLTQFAPELLLAVEGGMEILDPVQCLPIYHHLSGTHVDETGLPMTIVETLAGWT